MIGAIAAVIIVTVVTYLLYKNAYDKPDKFPPGPPSVPIYGAYLQLRATEFNNISNALLKIGKNYKTKLIGMYLAFVPSVFVNDSKLIKEMLYREDFDGRMDILLFRLRSYWKKLGIFFTDGYFWHVQRRFSLRYMRDFGFGRRSEVLEEVVENEIKQMIDMTIMGPKYPGEEEYVKGDLISLPHYFAPPFINGICHVFARMTIPRSDYYAVWNLAKGALTFQRNSDDIGGLLSLTPWVVDIFPNWCGYNQLIKGNQMLLDFFEKLIKECIETFEQSHDRHFLDMYIRKMKEEKLQGKPTTYSVQQLSLTCVDYMFPAASATEAVLTMIVERLLLQPEIQTKIHEEIDRVVGQNRLPNLDDRQHMPYTEAVIREAMRLDTLVPLGVPHRAMEDTTFGGHFVPEGTLLAANYVVLHTDKDIWGDPENFRPERFITDGKLNVASDKSLPFGAGRRLCAGETYARQTMFQVFSGFMQAFRVSTADGKPLKKPAPRIQGIITTIPDFWVRVTPRNMSPVSVE